ncbi:MAG: tripartite tricarboxylate transporter substrate binding protein BugD [Betaproteobacteria bacterium]|nr:tripartite tricarboxylate transporter substrate binding protein BugD [Betaproteobacteria bacterium]
MASRSLFRPRSWTAALTCAFSLLVAPTLGSAQDFPSRPITLTMPYAPGGPGDAITRVFASSLQKHLGVQVVVDNPAGASGTIGTAKVARARPDGYTLLMIHVSHATNGAMFKSLPYSPVEDFEPVARGTSGPMVIVARQGFPATTLPEFIQYLRANADKISLAHAGVGSASHLCALMMMSALNVKLNEVPYKGTAPALADLMGGQVDVLCDQTSGTVPQVRTGRIRAVAAAGRGRLPQLPDVPAVAEAGVDGLEINISFGLYAPKGTPKPVIDRLVEGMQKSVADTDTRARLEAMGVAAVPVDQATPEALRAHLKREIDTLVPLLVRAGVQPN